MKTDLARLSLSGIAATALLASVLAVAQTQAPPQGTHDPEDCKGSTVDEQGAKVAKASRAFLAELQTAVGSGDRNKVASMISYPFLVIQGIQRTKVKTKAEFLAQYDAIFDDHVRRAIAQQSAKCLFGNYQGTMIGTGEVWFSERPHGSMKIITVNSSAAAQ
jgi:hypothetical protein